jgi:hypothetical protein
MGGDLEAHVGFGVRLVDGMLSPGQKAVFDEGRIASLRLLPVGFCGSKGHVLALASSVSEVAYGDAEHIAFDAPEWSSVAADFRAACAEEGIDADMLGEPWWHLALHRSRW